MNKKKTRSSGGGSGGGLANRDRPGSSGSLNRQSTPTSASKDKEQPEYLGYNMDQRVTYISSSIIGTIVSIELDDGVIYEGVFRTFSPEFELTISQMHKVDPKDPTRIDPETVKETGVFNMNRIVRLSALDVDLNAAKEGFMTDSQIGKGATTINGERDLEMWMPDGDDDHNISLDLGSSTSANGWDAEDMFKANEQNYGVHSTYKSNLEGYTIQLKTDKNSDDYRKLEAIAAAKAQEIEGSMTNKLAIELENGDEEEAFSAVVRTTNNNRGDDDSGKYVTPARRGQPSSRNNNTTPMRGQQGSPMSRGDDRGGQRGRREYQGSSPASAHPGREQHYHDDYARGGGGASNRGGRGGGPFKGDPRGGPGGKSHRDEISDLKQFKDNFHLNTNEGGKQPSPPTAVQSRNSPHDRKGASPPNKVEPQRKASPPTASIINRQESVEQRTPTPAKTPPTVAPPPGVAAPGAGAPTTPSTGSAPAANAAATGPTATGVPHPPPSTTPINVTKSKLNPNAKEFVLNPKAKEFVPPSARPSVGQTPPPQRPITPATPTGSMPMPMPGYYPNIPFSQAGAAAGFPYIASVPGGAPGAHSYLYAPTSQPPPHPQHYGQQQRFRGSGPPASQAGPRGDASNPVLAATGQPLLSPQNNFATLIPPNLHMPPQGLHQQHPQNPHQQQQQIAMAHGSMVPVSGGPPVMVRPMDASGAQSLPAWVQSNQPPPQMGGPPHPPPTGTPTSANQPPLPATPPTSGGVPPPPSNHPQGGGPAGHQPPQMGHVNGGHAAAAANAAGMYNLIPGSMQHAHHFPQQFQIPQQLLLQPGQTSLIQQPIMTQQGQPVTSIASGMPQFPYVSHHAGVVPAQQSSPQFIIAPHPMAVAGNQAAGGPGATANAAANQMQPPPQ